MLKDKDVIVFRGGVQPGTAEVTHNDDTTICSYGDDGEPITFKLTYGDKVLIVMGYYAPHICETKTCGWIWSSARLVPHEYFDCEGQSIVSEDDDGTLIALLSLEAPKGTVVERLGWGWEE